MKHLSLVAHPLSRPLSLATAAVALAGGLAYAGHLARQAGVADRDRAAQRLSHAQARLDRQQRDRAELHGHADLFRHLEAKGRIGKPRLLEWSELLHRLQRHISPATMEYEFAPPKGKTNGSEMAFHTVPMKLRLQVLHEGDLLHFLSRLQEDAQALVLLRRCRLARQGPTGALHAECDMDWATAVIEGDRS